MVRLLTEARESKNLKLTHYRGIAPLPPRGHYQLK